MADKPLITIKLKKRHLFAVLIIVLGIIFGYSIYFKAFMTLPQSSISLVPQLPFDISGKKIIVYSPHCDDETLGEFGLINHVISTGGDVKLVMVTDCNHHANGGTRKSETIQAMGLAGLSKDNIEFLDFAEAQANWSDREATDFQKDVNDELDSFQPDYVIAPHPSDTHDDHQFVGTNVEKVLDQRGEQSKGMYYLVHYNFLKYPSPPGLKPEDYILPPARLVNLSDRWYKFNLTQDEEDAKEQAVMEYKSQLIKTNPILRRVLFDFVRRNELFMMRG